jgi:hypothetical protein
VSTTADLERSQARATPARRLYLPSVIIAAIAAGLGGLGWEQLSDLGVGRAFNAGRFELAGPAVLGFVLVMFGIEQLRPAVRRPLLTCATWSPTRWWWCRSSS